MLNAKALFWSKLTFYALFISFLVNAVLVSILYEHISCTKYTNNLTIDVAT